MFRAFTLKSAERQVDPEAKIGNQRRSSSNLVRGAPVIWAVGTIAAVLVVISIIIGLVIRARMTPGPTQGPPQMPGGHPHPAVVAASKKDGKKKKKSAEAMKFPSHHHHQQHHHEMELSPEIMARNGEYSMSLPNGTRGGCVIFAYRARAF